MNVATVVSSDVVSRRVTLIILSLASFFFPVMMSSVTVALPSIGEEFAMEAVQLGWVSTIYSLTSAVFQVPAGRLADIAGRKKIFTSGILVQMVAAFSCAIATSGTWLIAARAVQAVGGAMTFGTSMAILTSVFPPGERGKAVGIYMAMVYLGMSTGPFIGGVLTQHLGWRSIFFLGSFLALVVALLVFWKMKGEWAEGRGEKYDLTGAVIFSVSLAALMYGFSVMPSVRGFVLFPLGLLGLGVFFRWENRVKNPVLDTTLFKKNAVFIFSNIATMINYGATFAVSFFLSLYLQYIKGFTPFAAGTVLMIQPMLQAAINPISGRIADRIEPRLVAGTGMAINCVGLSLLAFLGEGTAIWYVILSILILGIGFGLFAAPNTMAVMGATDKRFLGVASGTLGTMRSTGAMLSVSTAMILFSLFIGDSQIVPASYPGLLQSVNIGFSIFTALCVVGVFFQLAGRRTVKETKTST